LKVKSVLISQPKPADLEKSAYADLINKHSIKMDFKKFFSVTGLSSSEFRQHRINLADYNGVVFTSRNAIDHYFRLAKDLRFDVPDTMKYFCTSDQIAYYLQKYIQFRKRKIFYGDQSYTSLVPLMKKHKEIKLLLPCNNAPNKILYSTLKENNINFKEAVFYKNTFADLSNIKLEEYDMLVFFSPHGIHSMMHNFPEYKQGDQLIAVYGNSTMEAADEYKLNAQVTAPTETAPSMTMAIDEFIADVKKKK